MYWACASTPHLGVGERGRGRVQQQLSHHEHQAGAHGLEPAQDRREDKWRIYRGFQFQ